MFARLVRALLLALALVGSACGRSDHGAGEAQAAPAPAPVAAPVEQVEIALLPGTFPRDIPIPEGLVAQSVLSEHAGSYVALFTGELDPDSVHLFFAKRLAEEGWTIDKTRGNGPEYGLFAQKDQRITTVIATRLEGKLHVELGVYGGD
jgi:hypothetical protein